MTDLFFESRVIHNPALGGLLLWRFTRAFFDEAGQIRGPELPLAMLVLPMAFHQSTVAGIRRMVRSSGIVKAVADNPFVRLGLQKRLESFSHHTFSAIHLACASGLMSVDKSESWPRLIPAPSPRDTPKGLEPTTEDVGDMVKAVDRLGWWFSRIDVTSAASILDVRF